MNFIHGMRNHPLYSILGSMRRRCEHIHDHDYKYYGGRGISICDRWKGLEAVANFLADMGPRPSAKHSIDRIDNNGNYEPGNCRWATPKEQTANRRDENNPSAKCYLTIAGVNRSVQEWAELYGIKKDTIFARRRAGWTDEDAVLTKLKSTGNRWK